MNRRSDRPKDYYSILGVSPTAELVVIRAAYRALALRYHPDTWAGDKTQAENLMRELNEAYEVLSNATSRKVYDEQREKPGFKDSRDRGHAEAGFGRRQDPSFGLNPIGRKIRLVFKWLAVSTFSIIAVFAVLIASVLAYDAYTSRQRDGASPMTIIVRGPDGSNFAFPEGTSQDTIDSALSEHYGGGSGANPADAPRPGKTPAASEWDAFPAVGSRSANQPSPRSEGPAPRSASPVERGASMTRLNIAGQLVDIDDGFLKLSPEDQNATVDDIARQLGISAAKSAEYDRNAAAISFQITADKRWCSDDKFPIYIYIKNSSPEALEHITLTLDAFRTDRSLNIAGYHLYSDDHIIDKGESIFFCWAAYLSENLDPRGLKWSIGTKSFRFRENTPQTLWQRIWR